MQLGHTAQTVTVTAEDDSIDNTGDERATTITHTVSAEDTDYEKETAGAVSVTVTDDDAAPTALTITVDTDSTTDGDKATISEGADKPTVQVTATLDGATTFATAKTVSVTVGSADDSATEGTGGDYDTVADISITLPVGAKSASGNFALTLNDDAVDEPDETISVAGTLADVTVTGTTITIEDDDATPTVTLTLTPATINESGATNASTVMATMDGLSSEPVTLTVSATPVTPAVAADFTLSDDTTLTIPALSQTSTGTVTVTAVDNDVDAVDKTVTVSATATGGNGVTAPANRTLTITDDDTRGITVTKTALTLSEEDDTTSTSVSEHQDTYSVVLTSEPAGGTVTITVESDDTTIAGVSPASLVFGATDWNMPKTVTVTAVADTADNPMDRRVATITHTVSAAGSDYVDETARRVTVTVNDDDGAPTLSINNPTVTEGDRATAALSFTVRLTPASGRQVTVAYADRGTGTARAGTDYTALAAGTLTFAPGDTSKTVAVTVTGDVIDEPDETVVVRLSSPANATLTGGETTLDGTGTIEDNDPTPTLSVADAAAVTEGDVATPDPPNNMTFTVQLSAASGRLVTVPYTLGGIATAGADYTVPDPLSVTIAPGSTEANITIPVKGDHVDEGNETVTVTLGTPTHATVSTAEDAGTATGTITDDDTRGITVSAAVAGVSVAEADDPLTLNTTENQATYTVVLDSQPTGTVTVNLESEDTDIATVAPARLTFTTGNWNTAQTVTVTGVADIIDNPNDRRTVDIAHTVSASGTDYATETADPVTVTVTDDDAAPGGVTLTVDTNGATAGTPDTVAEGAGATAVTVSATVDGATRYAQAQTVTVSVDDGTAASPADYAAVADFTIAIPAGGAGHSGTFTITPVDDALDEPDETVTVTGAAGSITVTPDVLTLTDNDAPPSFSIAAAAADEGDAVVFTVSRAGATANVATVKVATAADTDEDAEAASAGDYTAINPAQTLSFAAGDTSKTVSVATVEDDLFEPDETFLAVLSMPALGVGDPGTGVSIAADGGRARGTIKDDDVRPSFSIADASATEGTAITFTVTRSGAEDNAVSVKWNTKADTGAGAAAATDYTASTTPTQLDFAGGVTAVTFTVATTADPLDEGNETFLVELTDAEGATITTAEATGTITDDDDAPTAVTLTVDADTGTDNVQDSIAEDGGAKMARITATITSATRFAAAQDVTVTVGKAGDSAAAGTDYDEVADLTITLPVGAASAHVDVRLTPKQDTLAEGDETISIEGELSGVTVTPTSLTLTDDESTPTVTLALDPASIDESGDDNESTVTATLSGASSQAVTLTVAATPVNPAVGDDFTLTGTTLTIAAGRTASTGAVTVTAVDNDVDAPDKTVTVSATASGGNGVANPADRTLTIEDDDTRGITVSAATSGVTVAEADNTATTNATENEATYTVVLDSQPTGTVTVNLESEDTDIATVAPARLTFTTGNWNTAQTVTVTGVADIIDNPNDRRRVDIAHTVSASGTDYATETADPVTVTVTDDDAAPTAITLTVDADTGTDNVQDSLAEDGGAKTVRVTATVTGATRFAAARDITVSVGAAGDSATEGTDYDEVADQTLTLAAGAASGFVDFTLTPKQDTLDEPDESIAIEGELTGVTFMDTAITLTDDDATPTLTLTLDPASIDESGGDNESTVTATLSGASSQAVTLTVAATPVNPAVADDFTLTGTTLTIAAGRTASTGTVTVTAVDNDVDAPDKTVTVSATATGGNGVADPANRTLTITDDDERGVTVTPGTLTVDEADDPQTSGATENRDTYTVALDSEPTGTVTIAVKSEDNTVATVVPATLTFTTSDWAAKTVTVTAVSDNADNPNDRRTVDIAHTVSASGTDYAAVTAAPVTVTVTDDDEAPVLSIDSPSVAEGDNTAATLTFTVTLAPASGKTVTVGYADRLTGTATSGTDYTALTAGTLTFAPGETAKAIAVTVAGDTVDETDETVVLRLSSAANATLTGGAATLDATGTIEDNDTATLAIADASAAEGDTATFTITLSTESAADVTVTATTSTGSGDTATAGVDYTHKTQELTIDAGDTEAEFDVAILEDTLDEPDETFTVTLSAASVTLTDATATGTITDDDDLPVLSIRNVLLGYEGDEGVTNLTHSVTLSPASGRTVTVKYADTGTGTATSGAGGDYATLSSGTLSFAPGETRKFIRIKANGDTDYEPDETIILRLSEPVNATLSGGKNTLDATGWIENDDAPPAPTINPGDTTVEEGETAIFTVSRKHDFEEITVFYGTSPGSADTATNDAATSGSDYTAYAADSTAVFREGEDEITLEFETVDDDLHEAPEDFTVTIGSGDYSVDYTVTISDNDDLPTATLALASSSISEKGGRSRVTASLDLPTSRELRLAVSTTPTDPAVAGDIEQTGQWLTIPAGTTTSTGTVALTGVDNNVDAPDKTITVSALLFGNSDIDDPGDQTLTVTDDDAAPGGVTLTVDTNGATAGTPDTVAEGAGATVVTVSATVDGATRYAQAQTVTVSVADGTAKAPADYAAVADFTIAIPAGGAGHSGTFTITPVDDALDEPDETVTVTGAAGSITVTPDVLTLTDNDAPPSFSIAAAAADEGDAGRVHGESRRGHGERGDGEGGDGRGHG